VADTREWLEDLGLGEFAEVFEREDIDLDALQHLSDNDLKELGLTMGPRRKVLAAIEDLVPAAKSAASSAAREAERRQITVMFCDLARIIHAGHEI